MLKALTAPRKNVDATTGPLWNKILAFFIPMLISTLITRLFHIMDVAVIGIFEGENELAAVGGGPGSVRGLTMSLISGLSIGVNILVSQLVGGKKLKTASKAIHTALFLSVTSGIVLMVFGIFISRPALSMLNTPPEVLDLAVLYLRLLFVGTPFLLTFSFGNVICRSKGDTLTPVVASIVSGAANMILNIIFVAIFKWGVAGVGIATIIANIVNASMILYALTKDEDELKLKLSELKPDKYILSKIMKLGSSSALYDLIAPISDLSIVWAFGVLGTTALASNSVASSMETLSFCVTGAFRVTAISFIGLNFGAKKMKRCRKALFLNILYSMIITYILDILIIVFRKYTFSFFSSDPAVIDLATKRLIYVFSGHFALILVDLLTSALRGYGYSVVPSIISILGICALRIVWIFTVFANNPTADTLFILYPLSFLAAAAAMVIYYIKISRKISAQYGTEDSPEAQH